MRNAAVRSKIDIGTCRTNWITHVTSCVEGQYSNNTATMDRILDGGGRVPRAVVEE